MLVLAPVSVGACLVEPAMKSDGDILTTLAVQFAIMSLLALGGANAVVPEIHRLTSRARLARPTGSSRTCSRSRRPRPARTS
jgi:hypothetical protein